MEASAIENNTSELINPLPNIIPNIVWDDLFVSQKDEIIDAVKSDYTVTYYHTARRHKKDESLLYNLDKINITTPLHKDNISNDKIDEDRLLPEDIDVIKIEEKSKESIGTLYETRIYSRATSERGILKLENPVPDIIPLNIWNNLPDVLKEEIIEGEDRKKNNSDEFYFNISYNPDFDVETDMLYRAIEKRIKAHDGVKDTITISSGWFFCRGSTSIYDAKRGLLIDGTEWIR